MFYKFTMTGVEGKRQEWYRGNSKMFRNMWDKGGVTMGGFRWLCDSPDFIYLLIYYLSTTFTDVNTGWVKSEADSGFSQTSSIEFSSKNSLCP